MLISELVIGDRIRIFSNRKTSNFVEAKVTSVHAYEDYAWIDVEWTDEKRKKKLLYSGKRIFWIGGQIVSPKGYDGRRIEKVQNS